MAINYFLVVCIVILILCCWQGARKGVLNMLYAIIAWILVLWFVSFSTPYIENFLIENTKCETIINEKINDHLHQKYEISEREEEGSGVEGIIGGLPPVLKDNASHLAEQTVDIVIMSITEELTELTIHAIAAVIAIILGYVLAVLGSKIIDLIGRLPGLRVPNRLVGIAGGLIESLFIIWILMYVAELLPTTAYGQFVLTYTDESEFLKVIAANNVVKMILG